MTVDVRPFHLELTRPFETGGHTIERRSGWVFALGGDVGGFGEATPLPGFTEDAATCEEALRAAERALRTEDWPAALAATRDAPAARHALVSALLDRRARERGVPLHRELGGRGSRASVPVQATIGDGSVAETRERAGEAVDGGSETLKVKVGARDLSADLDRLRAVRDRVGGAVALRIDANAAWTVEQARAAMDSLASLGVDLLEQPLAPDDLAGHRALRGSVPIALDESLSAVDPTAILEAEAADALVLKPMALGGVDVARGVARRARGRGLSVVVSNTIEGTVGRLAALHLAASLPAVSATGLGTASLLATDLAPDPAPVSGGHMRVPEGPGLGIEEVSIDA
ncbi:MAG: mandelate racemase/muconate lactonizing enzyme family protein [Halanaeroarchaeum sp.]